MNLFTKVLNYFKGSKEELKKVVWPSKKETVNFTLLVIIISLGVAIFLGIVDWLMILILNKILK